jgi:hypothetical protein
MLRTLGLLLFAAAASCSPPEAAPGVHVGTTLRLVKLADGTTVRGGRVVEIQGSTAKLVRSSGATAWVDFGQAASWE